MGCCRKKAKKLKQDKRELQRRLRQSRCRASGTSHDVGAQMRSVLLGAGALLLLCTILYEVAPDQLYRDWQQTNRKDHDVAERAAENYLRVTPEGTHARELRAWLAGDRTAPVRVLSKPPQVATAAAPEKVATPDKVITAPQPAAVPQEINPEAKPQPEEAQDTSHDAKPETRSLGETLAYIAGQMSRQGPIRFMAQFRNPANDYDIVENLSYEASNVTVDPNRCQVSYRWHVDQDGKGTLDEDRSVPLRQARSVRVETVDRTLSDINAASGRPYSVHVQPEVYAVHLGRYGNTLGDNLYFRDEAAASRVGEAAHRALNLCSGRAGTEAAERTRPIGRGLPGRRAP
jgi:hypothetical protein